VQNLLLFLESELEYYMPGVDHKSLTDEEFAMKVRHLRKIRKDEAKRNGLT